MDTEVGVSYIIQSGTFRETQRNKVAIEITAPKASLIGCPPDGANMFCGAGIDCGMSQIP